MIDGAPRAAVVVLAGGSGTRLGRADGRNKVYLPLGGVPLLAWSLRRLDAHPSVVALVVVVRAGDEDEVDAAIAAVELRRPPTVATGGATRTASERAGTMALRPAIDAGDLDVVLVHDGARPFVTTALVDRLLAGVPRTGAAIPALAPAPGLVSVSTDGLVSAADTHDLRQVQTPQAFDAATLLAAFAASAHAGLEAADTAELVRRAGGPAATVVAGDPLNIKVTTPADVERAAAIAARQPW